MDYNKFIRNNFIIQSLGYVLSIVLECLMFVFPNENAIVGIFPMLIANVIVPFRGTWLSGRENFNADEYNAAQNDDRYKKYSISSIVLAVALLVVFIVRIIVT